MRELRRGLQHFSERVCCLESRQSRIQCTAPVMPRADQQLSKQWTPIAIAERECCLESRQSRILYSDSSLSSGRWSTQSVAQRALRSRIQAYSVRCLQQLRPNQRA